MKILITYPKYYNLETNFATRPKAIFAMERFGGRIIAKRAVFYFYFSVNQLSTSSNHKRVFAVV